MIDMEKMLRELTDLIYKYNNALDKKVLTIDDVQEEEENLKDILKTKENLEKLLLSLKEKKPGDLQIDNENLMKLHTLLDNFSWYFQNIHKVLMDLFKNYPSSK
jgi:hypothetical protein